MTFSKIVASGAALYRIEKASSIVRGNSGKFGDVDDFKWGQLLLSFPQRNSSTPPNSVLQRRLSGGRDVHEFRFGFPGGFLLPSQLVVLQFEFLDTALQGLNA
jgi:hypothetical protein